MGGGGRRAGAIDDFRLTIDDCISNQRTQRAEVGEQKSEVGGQNYQAREESAHYA